ncbi:MULTISPECIES: dentilisin complex serine proteinase subunit PrtP [unclassified Treponema]|uniref:dentilisin complex serine proteinase subunit PrtP n=1 Tax=unclassified Treponema TaxID=2638727 RepID=UPI0020A3AC81|nr:MULTISPECIES: dentilisin complex serine proteinase subunit PrtP [unclassified Treponema]UTC67239.1 dentilisin complex serine proteinase subunit PrtP [Treponema sp. OMZ 789]UTC69968.1 dentilisin complex serine proteinase subunit PrtP [Treponema sp. OMZ 790]UTC72683.1 dentilisin complex serine proteinase subunit PrtP [Treponema sp. OMZ 791]
MKKIFFLTAIALLVSSCNLGMNTGGIDNTGTGSNGFTGGSANSPSIELPDGANYAPKDEDIVDGFFIVKTRDGFDKALFEEKGFAVKGNISLTGTGFTYWYLNKEGNNKKNLSLAASIKGVLSAEHDYKVSEPDGAKVNNQNSQPVDPAGEGTYGLMDGNYLDDPIANNSDYGLSITEALRAYREIGYGNKTVVAGIIDTGINMTHKDFKDEHGNSIVLYAKSCATAPNGAFIGSGNPFTDIPIGQNWDKGAHGTHCSGTIAARGNNGTGIAGVAWKNTKLISYQSLNAGAGGQAGGDVWSVYGAMADLTKMVTILRKAKADRTPAENAALPSYLRGTDFQITQKTVPVNMSLGGSYGTEFAFAVLTNAVKNNVLPVIAMGNEGRYTAAYPAAFPGVLAVGATNGKDKKVHFSNSGAWISVSAPGDGIKSCGVYSDDDYETMSGTSMATPFVTGFISYLLSFPEAHDLTPYQIKTLLEKTCDKIEGATGFTDRLGHGRVNVYKAAKALKNGNIPPANDIYSEAEVKVTVKNNDGTANDIVPAKITLVDEATKAPLAYVAGVGNNPAIFKGLVKGHLYSIYTSFFGEAKKEVFTMGTADKDMTFQFNKKLVFVSTVKNLHYNGGNDTTDTIITVYKADSAGNLPAGAVPILDYDSDTLDTVYFEAESGGKYYVKITGYGALTGSKNYVIGIDRVPLDPAGAALDDPARSPNNAVTNDSHENDDTAADAKVKGNAWGQKYACNLVAHPIGSANTDEDWFYVEHP